MFNLVHIFLVLCMLHLCSTNMKGRIPSLDIFWISQHIRTSWENWAPTQNWHSLYQTFRDPIYCSVILILEHPVVWDDSPLSYSAFVGSKAPIPEKNFHLLLPSNKYFTVREGRDKLNGEISRKVADRNDSIMSEVLILKQIITFLRDLQGNDKRQGLITLDRP